MRYILLALALVLSVKGESMNVLVFAGSTREQSFNKKLAAEAANFLRQKGANVTFVDLKDYPIPFYNGDLESKEGMPPKAKQLRDLFINNDFIFISTPEYNGSIPSILKNVIDWASRNELGKPSRDAFKGKKFVIMSASPGSGGGARAQAHLRSILESAGGTVLQEQITVPDASNAFDEQGKLKNEKIKSELQKITQLSGA